jgi:hypothetical protein
MIDSYDSASKLASDTFEKMGISVKNSDGSIKNSDKVLLEMADAFQKLPKRIPSS